ncbi:PhnD/SsuA/transferrin family substrate-binding protein [Mycoplasma zalophi]|uniref:PhnD/SsuA/transferrin family substrate-binding protein n=1 Tax=Mycoplasma zalophi TaxID=191287 RepID=A0ABS6DQ85_9MOLU|nr:PhnD/SsuA/transferrin family substrate-binding protein [Mycoplasma zalophi]MBU4691302.1 PhnD/SsuA/transferrin family substrate-binding protein [Mycoplasma zalophi]MBU4692492.1 PhnD/SsuA/transferrin family substrate-binding protein [Mycoplasma zalophi]
MKKNKKLLFSVATLGLVAALASIPVVAASCAKNETKSLLVKANGYSDQMTKLDLGTATLAGGWGDTRSLIKNGDNLVVVGATEVIANDGVQVRPDLKRGDVEAIQAILKDAIKDRNAEQLQIKGTNGKNKFVFAVYNHNDYSTIAEDAKIAVDTEGTKVNAYQTPLVDGSDYFEKTDNGYVQKANSETFKMQFIPSNDPAEVRIASQALENYLKAKGYNVQITTATEYNTAANALRSKTIDLAFLPAGSWAQQGKGTNFILVAGRGVQIVDPYLSIENTTTPAINDEKILIDAMNGYKTFNVAAGEKNVLYVPADAEKAPKAVDATNGYSATLKGVVDGLIEAGKGSLPVVGFYRSYIMAKKDSPIAKKIQEALNQQGKNWKLPWSEVKDLISFAYTSTTSSASYIFPEAWFKKHFEGFKSFKD